jgi:hypothetical protein
MKESSQENHQNGRIFKGEGDLIQISNYYFYCLNDGLVTHATQAAGFVHIKTYGVVIGDRYELIV